MPFKNNLNQNGTFKNTLDLKKNFTSIESNNSKINSYELFDLNGKLVNENKFYHSTQLNLSKLVKGTYLLKVYDGDRYVNKKIIVE